MKHGMVGYGMIWTGNGIIRNMQYGILMRVRRNDKYGMAGRQSKLCVAKQTLVYKT